MLKIEIDLDLNRDQIKETETFERLEDKLRDLIIKELGESISGTIEDEITGNSTTIDPDKIKQFNPDDINISRQSLIDYVLKKDKNQDKDSLSALNIQELIKIAKEFLVYDLAELEYDVLSDRDIIEHFADLYSEWPDEGLFEHAKDMEIIKNLE